VLPIAVDLSVTVEDPEASPAWAVDARSIMIGQPAEVSRKRSRGKPKSAG
jgi:hypothetical protein